MAGKKQKPWKTKEAKKIAETVGMKALRAGMESILTDAIDLTPVDSGTLRRSGTVTVGALPDFEQVYVGAQSGIDMGGAFPNSVGKEKVVYISFNTPYARRQHEDIGFNHPRGGQAKYLEVAFARNKEAVKGFVERSIKKALKEAP